MTQAQIESPTYPKIEEAIDRVWESAREHWAQSILLKRPVVDADHHSVARLDLRNRQIFVSGPMITDQNLLGSMEAILAHEVGHHARYPRSMATAARMRMLETQLIPLERFTAINLFTDLLINEHLGRRGLHHELAAVYLAGGASHATPATFLFTLAIYEELWQLEPRSLVGTGHDKLLEIHESYRAEAHLVAQDLFRLGPNIFTQFLFYLSVLSRYLTQEAEDSLEHMQHACNCAGDPTNDDWATALNPSALEDEAVDRAEREGWLAKDQIRRLRDAKDLSQRTSGLPGSLGGMGDRVPEIMAAWYRRKAEQHLIKPPPQRHLGEAVVPTVLEEWEPGDPLTGIDWLASLRTRGPKYGAAAPMVREPVADHDGLEVELWQPRSEIYLDVSGSMADPRLAENAMTLAAMIVAVGTLRAGGWARALIYSHEHVKLWNWTRSVNEMSRFLMHYVGGGTEFPFHVLEDSVEACTRTKPVRIVLTDRDFHHNVNHHDASERILRDAAAQSPLILMMHFPEEAECRRYTHWGARVVPVQQLNDFPTVAAQLARALFGERA